MNEYFNDKNEKQWKIYKLLTKSRLNITGKSELQNVTAWKMNLKHFA